MTTILAIDQSYTSTGYCLFKGKQLSKYGIISSNKDCDVFERAWQVTYEIKTLAKQYSPTLIALEGLAFGMRGSATRDLAGLQYTIVTHLRFIDGFRVEIFSPNTVKKVATGKGNSKKIELYENLPKNALKKFESLGVKKSTGLFDLTDAYWIGQTALQLGKQ